MSRELHEPDAIPLRRSLRVGAITVAIGLVAVAWSTYLDHGGAPRNGVEPTAAARAALESGPIERADVAAAIAHQRQQLEQAVWVDRHAGVASIPIELAMDAYVTQVEQAGR